jgi:hypothetical protein
VGEEVELSFSAGVANWTTTGGVLSAPSGNRVVLTAPDRAATVTVKAVGASCTATLTFKIVEPSGVIMKRASGTGVWHTHGIPSVGIRTDIFLTPARVSFEYVEISEADCVGAVTGYFVGTTLDGLHHAGHGAGVWVTVGQVKAGTGSKVNGRDTAQSGHCNFGLPYAAGTFDWPIPWKFRVGAGAEKQFATVHQRFKIGGSGAMTVSKAGAAASKALNDPTSTY